MHGSSSYNGATTNDGCSGGPYVFTICGVPLNGLPDIWRGQVAIIPCFSN